jgi:hypothetical protein
MDRFQDGNARLTSDTAPSLRSGISRSTMSCVPGERMAVSISPGEIALHL